MQRESKVIAAALALIAFAIAVLAGIAAQNSAETVLFRALLAMPVAHAVGLGVAALVSHIYREHIDRYHAANPIPDVRGTAPAVIELPPDGGSAVSKS